MTPQSNQLDERFAGTFQKLFDTIERGGDQCSIDRLQTLLEEKTPNLSSALATFGEPSAQSRSKLTSGTSVTVDGKSLKLSQSEKDLVVRLADFLHANELACASLWSTFQQEKKIKSYDGMKQDDDLVWRITEFYYQDRIALLGCIASLIRISFDDDQPYAAIARDAVNRIVKDDFSDRLLTQLKSLARKTVPAEFDTKERTLLWANQNLREQRGLLEILFLVHLNGCTPQRIFALFQEFEASSFGQQQAFGFVLDKEGEHLRDQVSYLSLLVSVEVLCLNQLRMGGDISLAEAPEVIEKIGQLMMFLGDRDEHAVPLLAWSCFLAFIDDLTADHCPPRYAKVRQLIEGTLEPSPEYLLDDRPSTRSISAPREPSIQPAAGLWRVLAGRAIKLGVFDHLVDMLDDAICDEDEVNSAGYRGVIKGLLSTFLTITKPYFLPHDSYTSLVKCTCKLFDNQAELCSEYWTQDASNDDIASLLSTAQSRFPVYFMDFTRLLSSMAGQRSSASASDHPATRVFEYIKTLPSLTIMLKDDVHLNVRVDNDIVVAYNSQPINIVQDAGVAKGFSLPSGLQGTLISQSDEKRVVQWRIDCPGWQLLIGVLAAFLQQNPQSPGDIEHGDDLAGKNIEVVNSILELINKLLHNNPSLGPQLVDHIEQVCRAKPGQPGQPPILVALLCEILSRGCSIRPWPIMTITYALRCITSLLPFYRNEIWSYLETAPILPRPNASYHYAPQFSTTVSTDPACQIQHIVNKMECTTGRYSLLLAFLDLVSALIKDVQATWWKDDEQTTTSKQCKTATLFLCLRYMMLDVFPSYAGWRYKYLSQRFLIGIKVLNTFIEIVQYFKDTNSSNGLSLERLRQGIINNFLYDGGIYHVAPLLDTVCHGAKQADKLYHAGRPKEAERAQKLTELTMVFIKLLLRQRLEVVQSGKASHESTLERLMLERTTGDATGPDFLLRLTKHIYYQHNTVLAILATDIVTLLCRNISAWQVPPNIVRHLGDKDQAQEIIRTYLSIAQDQFQQERLLASIWQMITLLMETQPSLAILFLECGEYIMPSPKSAVKLLEEQKKQQQQSTGAAAATPATESAIRAAVDLLGHWEMLSMEKPTVLSNVLRFLATFWQTAFDHYMLVQRTRSDSALWDALGKILLNPSRMEHPGRATLVFEKGHDVTDQDEEADLRNVTISNGNEAVRRICCLNISKAFVMRIMAFEIHLTAGTNKGSITDKLPAGLKNQLAKMNDPNKLQFMRETFAKNSFDEELANSVKKDAQVFLESVGIQRAPDSLLYTVGTVGFGDDDESGEPKQYGDSYLYDLRIADARVQPLIDVISKEHNVDIHDEDAIVTPAVWQVRKVTDAGRRFLLDLCATNHNWSLVDTEIVMLRSFKVFIEACSCHVSDVLWNGSNKTSGLRASSLFDFLTALTRDALADERTDGVSLTTYSVQLELIRGLTEDWIRANCNVPLERNVKMDFAEKCFSLLETYSGLLQRQNFALIKSVSELVPVAYHRPVLESILIPLRSLRKSFDPMSDFKQRNAERLKKLLSDLIEVACECFQMLVYKTARDTSDEECAKDMSVCIALIIELINPSYPISSDQWLAIFRRYDTIPSLLKLIYGGIDLMISEINKQFDGHSNLNISPYAEDGCYLLLVLSGMPETATVLMESGLLEMFCHNTLTPILQQGQLNMFLRFGFGDSNQKYVERNPLHTVWCHMLCVLNNLLRTLSKNTDRALSDKVLQNVVSFLQIYGPQVDACFRLANGANDSLLGLTPSESLASCLLSEVDQLSMIMFELAKQLDRVMSYTANLFVAYKDCALTLLQRYLYFFTHPAHLQAQLYPINNTERKLAEELVVPSSLSSSNTPSSSSSIPSTTDVKTSRLMQQTMQKAVRIQRNILITLIQLTDVKKIIKRPDIEWPFGNTILCPNLRVAVGEPPSFGTMIECSNAALGLIKEFVDNKAPSQAIKGLISVVEGSVILLSSQIALWIGKPGIDEDGRREIADDALVEVVMLLGKIYVSLGKLELPADFKDQKERTQTQVAQLKQFLADRHFNL